MLHSDQHGREHEDVGVVRWQDVKRDHRTSNYLRLAVLEWHELTMIVSAFVDQNHVTVASSLPVNMRNGHPSPSDKEEGG